MAYRKIDPKSKQRLQDPEWLKNNILIMSVVEIGKLLDIHSDLVYYYLDKAEIPRAYTKIKHRFIEDIECKKCTRCDEWKPLTDFCKSIKTWDGLGSHCTLDRQKRYLEQNTPEARERILATRKRREKTDLEYKLRRRLRSRIWHVLVAGQKSISTMELLGCSIEELKSHLESQFVDGMSWENYGLNGWEIDHIKPCVSFILADPEEQKKCFHYTNLQPLWMADNRKKGGKL